MKDTCKCTAQTERLLTDSVLRLLNSFIHCISISEKVRSASALCEGIAKKNWKIFGLFKVLHPLLVR